MIAQNYGNLFVIYLGSRFVGFVLFDGPEILARKASGRFQPFVSFDDATAFLGV